MKKVLALLSLFIVMSCGSDDENNTPENPYNFEMEVAVSDITLHEATISWNKPLPSEWSSVTYEIVLNNEEIASGIQTSEYTFTNLEENKVYTGTVYAAGDNGQESSANFSFTTKPYIFEMAVEIDEIGIYEASISWNAPIPSEWGSVVYKVVLNNEVIVDGLQNTNYTISDLDDNRGYNGTVFAKGTNGDETFAHFSFTTLPYTITGGSVTLRNQQEVDDFFYSEIGLSLTITGSDITDISNLSSLVKLGDDLIIKNTSLTNLNGLQNIEPETSHRKFELTDNPQLSDIGEASGFSSTMKELEIYNNASLSNISNLQISSTLTSIRFGYTPISDFSIFYINSRYDFIEFDYMPPTANLANLFSGVQSAQNLTLKNLAVTDLSFISNFSASNLYLKNIPITNFSSLSSWTTIYYFQLSDMPLITNMEGLDSLERVLAFDFNNNPNLVSFDGLLSLDGSGAWPNDSISLFLVNNSNLRDYCSLREFLNTVPYRYENGIPFYNVNGNAYNPTKEEIKTEAGCSL